MRPPQRPARPRGPRVSSCNQFRGIFVLLIFVWFLYLGGVIYMAIGVHKLDVSARLTNATASLKISQETRPARELSSLNQITKVANTQKAQDTASLSAEKGNLRDPIPSTTRIEPSKVNTIDTKQKEKRKIRRPNFKPNPHGYMVEPENFLKSIKQSKRADADSQRLVPDSQVLSAYLEPIDQSLWDIQPLPKRNTTAQDLTQRKFPKLNSCSRLTEQWPVDDYPDEDPFLPWIHDVFPTHDGKYLQFVAQNKRRCRTGSNDEDEAVLKHMAPQVALFQHVPLKQVAGDSSNGPRYRLSSHDDADTESISTRFICRFKPSGDITFSRYNNDYEWVAFRKKQRKMFDEDGRDNKQIQTAQLLFQCPIPEHLIDTVRAGTSVIDDWATLFVDLIPVRTPPRYGPPAQFLVPHYLNSVPVNERRLKADQPIFDPEVAWGSDHILPALENSGRWENIPICKPSLATYEPTLSVQEPIGDDPEPPKQHHLVSCLLASTGYATRGNRFAINDGQRRLVEWIHFNKILGFDHFYIYDNSAAFTNKTSLQPLKDLFPNDVTIINWPSRVCNNNPNNVDNVGERSSQYAAESSCMLRFGPHVEWIGQFDMDEYLVPMGNYTSVLPLLDKLDQENIKAISFNSWRAWPRMTHINPPVEIRNETLCGRREPCFELSLQHNATFLEGYNCDRQKPGQKTKVMPAEKQIYKPSYVKQHFVHYSTVTETTNLPFDEYTKRFGNRRRLFPDPLSRFADEVEEGLMLHTKAIARQDTAGWVSNCHTGQKGFDQCRIGFPWPEGEDETKNSSPHNQDGWNYNCFVNTRIDNFWGPQLRSKLKDAGFLSRA